MSRAVYARTATGRDTGQARLLQLGYNQQLPRLLPWQQNAAICFSIVSVPTAISGIHFLETVLVLLLAESLERRPQQLPA